MNSFCSSYWFIVLSELDFFQPFIERVFILFRGSDRQLSKDITFGCSFITLKSTAMPAGLHDGEPSKQEVQ